jgi:hypothetical protein
MTFDKAVHLNTPVKPAGAKPMRRIFTLPLAMTALILPNRFAACWRD